MAKARESVTVPEKPRTRYIEPRQHDECQAEELESPYQCGCYRCRPEGWCQQCLAEGATDPQPVGVFHERGKIIGDRNLCRQHNAKKYEGYRIDAPSVTSKTGFAKVASILPLDIKNRAAGDAK